MWEALISLSHNSSLWMTISVLVSVTFMTLATWKKAMVPGRVQVAAEMMYGFIANMIRENIGTRGMRFPAGVHGVHDRVHREYARYDPVVVYLYQPPDRHSRPRPHDLFSWWS